MNKPFFCFVFTEKYVIFTKFLICHCIFLAFLGCAFFGGVFRGYHIPLRLILPVTYRLFGHMIRISQNKDALFIFRNLVMIKYKKTGIKNFFIHCCRSAQLHLYSVIIGYFYT